MSKDPGAELVDVVDDARVSIGTAPRREMRARRLPHRAAYVLVFNRRSELLIHLRTLDKDVYPGHWDVAIGGVRMSRSPPPAVNGMVVGPRLARPRGSGRARVDSRASAGIGAT